MAETLKERQDLGKDDAAEKDERLDDLVGAFGASIGLRIYKVLIGISGRGHTFSMETMERGVCDFTFLDSGTVPPCEIAGLMKAFPQGTKFQGRSSPDLKGMGFKFDARNVLEEVRNVRQDKLLVHVDSSGTCKIPYSNGSGLDIASDPGMPPITLEHCLRDFFSSVFAGQWVFYKDRQTWWNSRNDEKYLVGKFVQISKSSVLLKITFLDEERHLHERVAELPAKYYYFVVFDKNNIVFRKVGE